MKHSLPPLTGKSGGQPVCGGSLRGSVLSSSLELVHFVAFLCLEANLLPSKAIAVGEEKRARNSPKVSNYSDPSNNRYDWGYNKVGV